MSFDSTRTGVGCDRRDQILIVNIVLNFVLSLLELFVILFRTHSFGTKKNDNSLSHLKIKLKLKQFFMPSHVR